MNKLVSLAAALLFVISTKPWYRKIWFRRLLRTVNATISGKVLDRTGKPMADAVVVYTDSISGKVYQLKNQQERGILRSWGRGRVLQNRR